MLQALCNDHDVTALTWQPCEITAINHYYGTSLDAAKVRFRHVPTVVRWLLPVYGYDVLKQHVFLRICKRIGATYDVILSACNECDFGSRRIQYIHYPVWDDPRINDAAQRALDFSRYRWYQRSSAIMRLYYRLSQVVSGFSLERMRRNVTLVNSDWTGQAFRTIHGADATTVYPPVAGTFPRTPWDQRSNGFVCVGRMVHQKRFERVIDILKTVRSLGWDIHLRIIGSPHDVGYGAEIQRLQATNVDWVSVDKDVPRAELLMLLSSRRYGIFGMEEEHFGIGVAEAVKAGCIVFVPKGGGQVEIVANDQRLTFADDNEAVEKIISVLADRSLQLQLRQHLLASGAQFSAERFMSEIRAVVDDFNDISRTKTL